MKLVHGKVPLTSSVTVSMLWQLKLTVSLADSMPQLLTKLAQSAIEVEREREKERERGRERERERGGPFTL